MAKQADTLCVPWTPILAPWTSPDADAALTRALQSWITPGTYRYSYVYDQWWLAMKEREGKRAEPSYRVA